MTDSVTTRETPDDGQLDREAAAWFARLRADNVAAQERERFARWLEADPSHAAAYAEYESVWTLLEDAAAHEPVRRMRNEALRRTRARQRGEATRFAAIAATVVAVCAIGLLFTRPELAPLTSGPTEAIRAETPIYTTAVGERATFTLTDGSRVTLNTDTALEVSFTEGRRDLRLLRGQGVFDVAHDASRPFVVRAGGQRITALGTVFDVRFLEGETRVTLIEGLVSVERDGGEAEAARGPEVRRLIAGEELIAHQTAPFLVRTADMETAISWRAGRVSFTDEPLARAVEEINRYSTRKVLLADPELGRLEVSGTFNTRSVDRFVEALELGFPVVAEEQPGGDVVVRRRR